jgi:hypothetical protein
LQYDPIKNTTYLKNKLLWDTYKRCINSKNKLLWDTYKRCINSKNKLLWDTYKRFINSKNKLLWDTYKRFINSKNKLLWDTYKRCINSKNKTSIIHGLLWKCWHDVMLYNDVNVPNSSTIIHILLIMLFLNFIKNFHASEKYNETLLKCAISGILSILLDDWNLTSGGWYFLILYFYHC